MNFNYQNRIVQPFFVGLVQKKRQFFRSLSQSVDFAPVLSPAHLGQSRHIKPKSAFKPKSYLEKRADPLEASRFIEVFGLAGRKANSPWKQSVALELTRQKLIFARAGRVHLPFGLNRFAVLQWLGESEPILNRVIE